MANPTEVPLRNVRPGDYVALFYDQLPAAREAVEPYAIEGLRRGDCVVLLAPGQDVDAWLPLSQRLDEMVRAGEVPGQFAALFYPPWTAQETHRILSGFLGELPRSFDGVAERHVRIVGELPGQEEAPTPCVLRLSCRECTSLCLFHAETMDRIRGGPLEGVFEGHSMVISLLPLDPRANRGDPAPAAALADNALDRPSQASGG